MSGYKLPTVDEARALLRELGYEITQENYFDVAQLVCLEADDALAELGEWRAKRAVSDEIAAEVYTNMRLLQDTLAGAVALSDTFHGRLLLLQASRPTVLAACERLWELVHEESLWCE